MCYFENNRYNSEEFKELRKSGEVLFPGSNNGKAIKAIKTIYNDEGYKDRNGEELYVDETYDVKTAEATMNYQEANNLEVDGIVGDETWGFMYEAKKADEDAKAERTDAKAEVPYIPEYKPDESPGTSENNGNYADRGSSQTAFNSTRMPSPSSISAPPMPENYTPEEFNYSSDTDFADEKFYDDIFADAPVIRSDRYIYNDGKKQSTTKQGETKQVGTTNTDNAKTETEDVGIIKPGYNAKGEWSEDPDADNYGKDSDAYKILNDLNSRWESATVKEKAEYYSIAKDIRRLEKEGTPIKYAQDEIINLLHENAEFAKEYQNKLKSGYSGMMYNLEGGSYFLDSSAFLMGMAYGKWNYKYDDYWRVPFDTFNGNDMSKDKNKNWRPWMYFDGMLISADKLGNMNMAYVGTKMGLPKFVFQNFLTNDKDDAFWVQYGIDLAEQGR